MTSPTDTPNGISLTSFAKRCGVSVAAVTNWRSRFDDFPDAIDPAAHRLKYEQWRLVQWAQAHGKLPPSVSRRKRRLYDDVADDLRLSSPDAEPLDVVAAASVLVLHAAVTGDVDDDELVAPAIAVASRLTPEFRSSQTAALRAAFGARPGDEVRTTIDMLRSDFGVAVRNGAWGEDVELAETAVDLGGVAETVIDPCCGIGNSLSFAARRLPAGTALVGRDNHAVRVAVAAALLAAEGVSVDLSVGDAFEPQFTKTCRAIEGTVLVIATPPADQDDMRKRKTTKKWITLLTSTIRTPEELTTTVLTTPAAWLTRSFLERGDERRPLLDQRRIDAAVLVTSSIGGRRDNLGITRLLGPRALDPEPTILLADLSYVPSDRLHDTMTALMGQWDAAAEISDRFAKVAQVATGAEVLSIGALVPQKYRDGRTSRAFGTNAQSTDHTLPAGQDVGELDHPIPPRSSTAMSGGEFGTAQFAPAERPEPFDVPTAALERLISSSAEAGASLSPRQPATPTVHDLVRRGDLNVFGAISGRQLDSDGDLVEVVTGNKGFGTVRQVSPTRVDASEQRRGAVYLQPTAQGAGLGVTVELLLAWFASAELQAEMWSMARAGRHRLSLSIHDVLDLRADFPPPDECARIAADWTEIQEVHRFAMRLNAFARFRRQHLLDRTEPPATED